MSTRLSRLAAAFYILVTILSSGAYALAATITVTSTADSGAGTLREAIAAANSGDTVVLDVAGIITLATPIAIDQNLAITGPGAISGGGTSQIFIVNGGFSVTVSNVTIEDGFTGSGNGGGIVNNGTLTISNGSFSGNFTAFGEGGAIYNAGTLNVTDSTIENSCSIFFSAIGGGIFNNGTLTVTNSTFSGNNGGNCQGAGLYNAGTGTVTGGVFSNNIAFAEGGGIANSGSLTVSSSTFSSNSATSPVGGVGGAIWNGGTLTVTNSTFENNVAYSSFTTAGGGAISSQGALTVTNSTFAGNSAFSGGAISTFETAAITESTFSGNAGGAIAGSASLKGVILAGGRVNGPNCAGQITDADYNISDDASCSFSSTGSLNSTDAQLDPNGLANNGGPTATIALQSTSPAVAAIPLASCTDQSSPPNPITTDQRGLPRPDPEDIIDPSCDIGAFELQLPVFSSFTAKLLISDGRLPGFALVSDFMVNATSGTIDPLTEPVSLVVGSYSATIMPGSFRQLAKGKNQVMYEFDGTINGAALDVRITPLNASFQLEAVAESVNLSGLLNPVTVAAAIGDLSGTTSVQAKFRSRS